MEMIMGEKRANGLKRVSFQSRVLRGASGGLTWVCGDSPTPLLPGPRLWCRDHSHGGSLRRWGRLKVSGELCLCSTCHQRCHSSPLCSAPGPCVPDEEGGVLATVTRSRSPNDVMPFVIVAV